MDEIMDRMGYLQEAWIEDRLRREKTRFTDLQRRIEIGSFTAAVHGSETCVASALRNVPVCN
jgi:hypothetical protein